VEKLGEDRPYATGLVGRLPGTLHLPKNLHLAKNKRVDARGYGEQVFGGCGTIVPVRVWLKLAGALIEQAGECSVGVVLLVL
jgi:hypothetical protein